MKPLVIYHANCTDGFGAAFAAWLRLGDEAEYLPVAYGKEHETFDTALISGREVHILDFSFNRGIMNIIFAQAKRVVWLDHHKTAFEMWVCPEEQPCTYWREQVEGTPSDPSSWYIVLDNNKSGAMLAWEYFHPGTEVPMLIQHIDDRDRWQFKLEGSRELHAALNSHKPWTFDQWWRLFYDKRGLGTNKCADLIQEGAAILRAHNQNVQATLKQARPCVIIPAIIDSAASYKAPWLWRTTQEYGDQCYASGLAANAPAFLASDLGHELANRSGTFGLVWSLAGDGQVHCSLRSNGDYDVSAIAKVFDGGGHRNAAGFSTDIDTLMSWLK